ncbi:hypothetical protein GGF31_004324 [Allomyces arbusculus]|nr:hypothetical protein GGF31_004324 [Allomyces arbusculus]
MAAVAQTPQWAAVVRGWEEAAVANAPGPGAPSPASVWEDLEHTAVMRDLRAVARARIDAAVYRQLVVAAPASSDAAVPVKSHAKTANDQVHAAAARLLDQLPPALRHLVALPRLVHLPATTAHGMRMRWTVWTGLLPYQYAVGNDGQVDADLIGKAKAWEQRVSATMAETFLAVRDTYSTVIPSALLGLATRIYAWCHVLSGQSASSKHRGLCDVWTVHYLTSRPTSLLAKVAIAFTTAYLMGRGFDILDADPDDVHAACVDVANLVLAFLNQLQVARRAQLMDLALRGSDVAPADAVQFEQMFRALFVGILPWGTLILVLDHLAARPDAFEAAEDVLVALVRASQGDRSKLARIDRSGLLTRLHPPVNTARRAAPTWLAPPSLAAEQARIEAMADTVAATPMRARVLVQRWQRVARACGTWAMYFAAIRARVRARRALPAPTAAPAPVPPPPPEETTPRETAAPAPAPTPPITNPLARLVDLVISRTVLAEVTDVPAGTVDWAMQRGVEYEEKIRVVELAAARARVAAGAGKTRGR